ncbi:MAG: 3'-5' exonuclease, partial [bacterium]|nr:3'-5' exonuclease [bacterium]
MAKIYSHYQENLKKNNALDFDDLLLQAVELLEKCPDVREYYQNRFEHILVDEYQDTNSAQYKLVKILAAKHRNLCVVGDDDQSIYRWRGADMNNILDFEKDYPEATVFKLEQNYRSTKAILNAANNVIANNIGRKEKTLWTSNNEGDPVVLFTAQDEKEEAFYVAHVISQELVIRGNFNYADCTVLYRTHAMSRVVEEAFMRLGIPYRVYGGTKFYERKEIRDLIAYLRLIVNPDDDVSFGRIVNVPRRGIGAVSLERLKEFATEGSMSLLEAAALASKCDNLRAASAHQFMGFAELISSLTRQAEFMAVDELVEQVIDRSGYVLDLRQERSIEADTRIENIQEFKSVAVDFRQKNPDSALNDFLDIISLVTQGDESEGDVASKVTLMSLHSAKGLEFSIVFMIGMEEGVFPHYRSTEDQAELEEERRLCYVGMTRARERLYLIHAFRRMLFGRSNNNRVSRFIEEIPDQYLLKKGAMVDVAQYYRTNERAPFGALSGSVQKALPKNTQDFEPADKVRHPKFGEGTVIKVVFNEEDTIVTAAFLPP